MQRRRVGPMSQARAPAEECDASAVRPCRRWIDTSPASASCSHASSCPTETGPPHRRVAEHVPAIARHLAANRLVLIGRSSACRPPVAAPRRLRRPISSHTGPSAPVRRSPHVAPPGDPTITGPRPARSCLRCTSGSPLAAGASSAMRITPSKYSAVHRLLHEDCTRRYGDYGRRACRWRWHARQRERYPPARSCPDDRSPTVTHGARDSDRPLEMFRDRVLRSGIPTGCPRPHFDMDIPEATR